MFEQFCWREKRCHMHSIPSIPLFIDVQTTTLPEGNAHYSMYGFTEEISRGYQRLGTKKHKIYEHYSSELIVDAETPLALQEAIRACVCNGWSFDVFDTGSGELGAHLAIRREATPSETLYLKDRVFVLRNFSSIPDIDHGIYKPMHLIRGIGRVHERTKQKKRLLYSYEGSEVPNMDEVAVDELLLKAHMLQKENIQITYTSEWLRFQKAVLMFDPANVKTGRRYTAIFALSKEYSKCGLSFETVQDIAFQFNSLLEAPNEPEEVERAVRDGWLSIRSY